MGRIGGETLPVINPYRDLMGIWGTSGIGSEIWGCYSMRDERDQITPYVQDNA